jgi:S1-C subfamily serine protease
MTKPNEPSVLQLSTALADAVSALEPSLVRIPGRRGSATGVAWASHQIVTTARALGRRSEVTVVLPDGSETTGAVTGLDGSRDIGLVTLADDLPGLAVPQWTDEAGLRVGHLVLVLGRPGRSVRATLGLVSAVGGGWLSHGTSPVSAFVDVDASFPMGFAGGPLVDVAGRVLGLNSRRLVPGGTTLPTATIRQVVQELTDHGSVRRVWLGVGVQQADLPPQAGQSQGLLVTSVHPGGPADEAGVLLGDALLQLDSTTLGDPGDLLSTLGGAGIDTVASLTLWRASAKQTIEVTLGQRPPAEQRGRGCG